MLTSFFSSVQSTMTRVMDPNEYDTLLTTLVASFSNVNAEIIIFALIVLAAVIFFLRRELALLDVLTLGKEQAINLGVNYDRCIRRLLLGVTLAIAVATAMVGPISFLGLIIANLARQLLRTYRHTQLILGSALFGMIVLVGGRSSSNTYSPTPCPSACSSPWAAGCISSIFCSHEGGCSVVCQGTDEKVRRQGRGGRRELRHPQALGHLHDRAERGRASPRC